jgi:hypothetical protein
MGLKFLWSVQFMRVCGEKRNSGCWAGGQGNAMLGGEGGSERLRGHGGEQSGGGIWIFFEDGDLE